ncbi:MarR family winged helix-turn-helix transcriptional regulator [Falsiroseomonas sp. HW251]|uniref:MarR family winged helix-turn-helix transcriptional regulator n=1 Tax=Falsiroseomonas sp. HW251 TaxID=3390998 RepID=UPI003D319370
MRRTPPLPLEESLGFQVRDLNRLMQRALAARLAPHGVAPGAWYFLRVLWEEDGLTQRELAARIGMQEPTAVIALRGMEEAGWITRTRSATDRRKVHVSLTPAGRALRETLLPQARAVIAEATRGLAPEDAATLIALLRRARAGLG